MTWPSAPSRRSRKPDSSRAATSPSFPSTVSKARSKPCRRQAQCHRGMQPAAGSAAHGGGQGRGGRQAHPETHHHRGIGVHARKRCIGTAQSRLLISQNAGYEGTQTRNPRQFPAEGSLSISLVALGLGFLLAHQQECTNHDDQRPARSRSTFDRASLRSLPALASP